MRVTRAIASNFQSYETIEFNYDRLGLTLVQGPTGAGKSTLLDVLPWTLYGITSKDSAADDVKAWAAEGPTSATIEISLRDGHISVTRVRGKSSQNDLYWLENGLGDPIRGKDLTETQAKLEARLGVTAELFMLCSYITQFSKTDSFFIAKAKDRREILEKIADQSFAVSLGEKAVEARKISKKELDAAELDLLKLDGRKEALEESVHSLSESRVAWEQNRKALVLDFQSKHATFDQDRAKRVSVLIERAKEWDAERDKSVDSLIREMEVIQAKIADDAQIINKIASLKTQIEALSKEACPTCKTPVSSRKKFDLSAELAKFSEQKAVNIGYRSQFDALKRRLSDLHIAPNPRLDEIQQIKEGQNPFGEKVVEAAAQKNPFVEKVISEQAKLVTTIAHQNKLAVAAKDLGARIAHLTWLYDKSMELRGVMMEKAVKAVQDSSNEYLERYFDAALRIELTLSGSDKLDVQITNNGYNAPFRQLSGGERCLLKLAFSLSIMQAAANTAGISVPTVMLDEAFNGLNDELKVKAFALLQELEQTYDTVLVIDHMEEFKSLFHNRFVVANNGGKSNIVMDEQQ